MMAWWCDRPDGVGARDQRATLNTLTAGKGPDVVYDPVGGSPQQGDAVVCAPR